MLSLCIRLHYNFKIGKIKSSSDLFCEYWIAQMTGGKNRRLWDGGDRQRQR